MVSDLSEATPEQLLHASEDGVREARLLDVRRLELLLAWADLHSGDPQVEPGAVPVRFGGPKLLALGGDGTPEVCDLALVEMAIARHEAVMTTRRVLADALDLRHRLPQTWAGVREGRCEVWVVRKVARMSRKLDRHQVRIVDAAVAAALDEAPSRILAIAEAKVIAADTVAHAARIDANRDKKGVWFSQSRPGSQIDDPDNPDNQAGIGTVFARLDEVDARQCARTVEDLATALAAHADVPEGADPLSMDHWRAEAFAMLADPAAVLAFYRSIEDPDQHQPETTPTSAPATGGAEIVVHLAHDADGNLGPLARVEGLGPRLLDQVRELLRSDANVTLTPVIDLHTGRSVNGYEHPTDVKHRTELRTVGDVFPHATGLFTRNGRTPDHDHTTPYDKHGPPGQTGDHNDTPLSRHHHRAKTHVPGYTVLQLGPDKWVWGTPHGLYRLVTGGGPRPITRAEYQVHAQQAIVLAAADYAA